MFTSPISHTARTARSSIQSFPPYKSNRSPAFLADLTAYDSSPSHSSHSELPQPTFTRLTSYTAKQPGKRRHMRAVRRHHKPLSLRAHIVAIYIGIVTVLLVLFVVAQQVSIHDDATDGKPAYQVRSLDLAERARRRRTLESSEEKHENLLALGRRQMPNITSSVEISRDDTQVTALEETTSSKIAETPASSVSLETNYIDAFSETRILSAKTSEVLPAASIMSMAVTPEESVIVLAATASSPSSFHSAQSIASQISVPSEEAPQVTETQTQTAVIDKLTSIYTLVSTLEASTAPSQTKESGLEPSIKVLPVPSQYHVLSDEPSPTRLPASENFATLSAAIPITSSSKANIQNEAPLPIPTASSTAPNVMVAVALTVSNTQTTKSSSFLVASVPSANALSDIHPSWTTDSYTVLVTQNTLTDLPTIVEGASSTGHRTEYQPQESIQSAGGSRIVYETTLQAASPSLHSASAQAPSSGLGSAWASNPAVAYTTPSEITQQDSLTLVLTSQAPAPTASDRSQFLEQANPAQSAASLGISTLITVQTPASAEKSQPLLPVPKTTSQESSAYRAQPATKTPESVIKEVLTQPESLVTSIMVFTSPGYMTIFTSTGNPITSTFTGADNTLHTTTTTPEVLVTSSVSPTVVTRTAVFTLFPESTASSNHRSGPIPADMPEFTITKMHNFLGHFLAPLLATGLLVCAMTLDQNAKMYQPFALLARREGACAEDSLTLKFYGLHAVLTPFRLLCKGLPLTALTTLLMWISWVLIAVSAEAVHLISEAPCKSGDALCAVKLSFRPVPSHVVIALMVIMLLLLIGLVVVLWKWDSGVCANPWSIAGIAALLSHYITREPLIRLPKVTHQKEIDAVYKGKEYQLNLFQGRGGLLEYGIAPGESTAALRPTNNDTDDPPAPVAKSTKKPNFIDMVKDAVAKDKRQPFFALSIRARLLFILYLVLLVAWIGYYTQLEDAKDRMVIFMNSGEFGPKFLLAMFGVVVAVAWTHVYQSIAILGPFLVIKAAPHHAETSVLVTRASNAYLGLWVSIKRRQPLTMVAATLSSVADFLPLIMCNIPQRSGSPIMRTTHNTCSALALAILVFMIAMLLLSLIVKLPYMPGDPRTIAGLGVYIADSRLISEIKQCQTSMVDSRQREAEIKELGIRFVMGDMVGVSKARRYGVEVSTAVHQSKHQERDMQSPA
ncbi:A-agglutinin anchorage subunit [Ceratocystis lukuohia]|uniref:A-agglutinin anchorage subunit n=1 Tax=Ceratocystis lukuohia TaxID=2019550 RepID=A0ABR4MSJ0_9PEZI